MPQTKPLIWLMFPMLISFNLILMMIKMFFTPMLGKVKKVITKPSKIVLTW